MTLLPSDRDPARGRWEVAVVTGESGPLLTVRANQASALSVLREIARACDLGLSGADHLEAAPSLTANLDSRPLEAALGWLLGSLGSRARITDGTIVIQDDLPPFATRDAVDERAEAAYIEALRSAPEHARADRAHLALAEIRERRGDLDGALQRYEELARSFPTSTLVPQALWRAAEILVQEQEWNRAAARLTDLAGHPLAREYRARSRVGLARVQCFLESPKKALYILDALEREEPAKEPADVRSRLLVRARALALDDKAVEGLRVLDALPESKDAAGAGGDDSFEVLEVRALALERCGKPSDAALAWLSFARNAPPSTVRDRSVENAARLALDAGDEVGVLLIETWAREARCTADLARWTSEARMRLGLTPPDPTSLSDEQWLARGEALLAKGATTEAVRALEPLYHRRARLDRGVRLRLASTFARALDAESRLSYAISVLREVAGSLSDSTERSQLYVLASELYERNERYEEAAHALRGEL
jgi:tetratricopeptide (TPR) repeat protein